MDEIQKAKLSIVLNTAGCGIGIATLLINTIPIVAIGLMIFCPYSAIRGFMKYRKLKNYELMLR